MVMNMTMDEAILKLQELIIEEMKVNPLFNLTYTCEALDMAIEALKNKSVVHAHWIHKTDEYGIDTITCSKCKEEGDISSFDYYYRGGKIRTADSKFCPHCGALMDEGDEYDN